MGNEIMSPNMQYMNCNPAMMTPFGGNMFGMGMNMGMGQLGGMTNYSNDLFAPDFVKSSYNTMQNGTSQNQSIFTNQNQTPQAPAQTFTGLEQQIQQAAQEQPLAQQEKTEENNTPSKTNIGKTTGAIAGLSIPLLAPLSKVINGAKFSDVFKFKEMGLKAVALAVAGWCAGALIDGFINSSRTQKASA